MNNEMIVEVASELDSFLNHGQTYLVYYEVVKIGNKSTFRAFSTKNKDEALTMHEILKNEVIKNMKSLITFPITQ